VVPVPQGVDAAGDERRVPELLREDVQGQVREENGEVQVPEDGHRRGDGHRADGVRG
jgi:hypothetical protein